VTHEALVDDLPGSIFVLTNVTMLNSGDR